MEENINYGEYETVIGLEVHAALRTETKIFCSCKNAFGGEPNTRCCPVCMGHPGALPVLNERVVELAILAGLVLNCEISEYCYHDRKNYFYPDLPKAYQISQLHTPLCRNGYVDLEGDRRIRIERIHIEEDAGKLIHDRQKGTMLDFNRCGAPLIEIVSKPDMRSGAEARHYLEALRMSLLFSGVSDCKMNEGSMRCDINISVRKKGDVGFGVRTEIKNLNSFAFAEKAIEYEARRQIELIESGGRVIQQTLRYDEKSGKTEVMREKENAEDYRYFTDPDLPPFHVDGKLIERLKSVLPMEHSERVALYCEKYGLSEGDGERLAASPEIAEYFEKTVVLTKYPKILAGLMVCELPVIYGEGDFTCPIEHKHFAQLCDLQGDGKINSSTAKAVLRELFENDRDTYSLVEEKGLLQINDEETLKPMVMKAIAESPKAVEDYKKGKKAAARSILGRVMGATGGRANPTVTAALVENLLSSF